MKKKKVRKQIVKNKQIRKFGRRKLLFKKRLDRRAKSRWLTKLVDSLIKFKHGILSVLIILGVLTAGYAVIIFWRVSDIHCQSGSGACEQRIVDWLASYRGKSVLLTRFRLEDEMSSEFPEIRNWIWRWNDGVRIIIDIDISKPVVAVTSVNLMNNKRYFLVNEYGNLIGEVQSVDLPLIKLNSLNTLIGERLPDNQFKAVDIVNNLSFLGYNLLAEQIDDQVLKVNLKTGETILFTLDGDRSVKSLVSALQLILSQATIESGYLEVDMRFNQPVIRDLRVEVLPPTPTLEPEATESGEIDGGV